MDAIDISALALWLAPVFYLAGVATAIGLPYLNAKKENPEISFDLGYVKWQIIFGIVGFLPTLATTISVGQLEAWAGQGIVGLLLAFGAGFGFGRGGREAQKTTKAKK
jgi:hypothetical protein